jgi:NADPH-dependent ferric siderophore reductase
MVNDSGSVAARATATGDDDTDGQAAGPTSPEVVEEAIAAVAPALIADLNEGSEDTIAFVAHGLSGFADVTEAELTGIDRLGVDLRVDHAEGLDDVRIDYAEPVTDPGQLLDALLGLVERARQAFGEDESADAAIEREDFASLQTYVTEVVGVADVHPHMRCITLGGGDLERFSTVGPDTFVYVLLPPVGADELTVDQSFSWEAYAHMPAERKPVGGYYTVRQWRPEAAEMDLLMILHDDDGPASAWAARAQVGDPVAVWGPRTSFEPPEDTDWFLLLADDTGLPATAGILEWLPEGTPARVLVEVGGPDEQLDLPARPGVEITWLHRGDARPGTTTLLTDAVRSLAWPEGQPYVWGGGESRAMTAVRRHVRRDRGLRREQVSLVPYWRRTVAPVADAG